MDKVGYSEVFVENSNGSTSTVFTNKDAEIFQLNLDIDTLRNEKDDVEERYNTLHEKYRNLQKENIEYGDKIGILNKEKTELEAFKIENEILKSKRLILTTNKLFWIIAIIAVVTLTIMTIFLTLYLIAEDLLSDFIKALTSILP